MKFKKTCTHWKYYEHRFGREVSKNYKNGIRTDDVEEQ